MRRLFFTIFFLTTFFDGFSQTGDEPKPLPPVFDRLTLDPGSGIPTLFWTPPNYNPLNPNPTGYIVYKRIVDNLGNVKNEPIDTVPPTQFRYTDYQSSGLTEQIKYTIASNGPTEPSPLTAYHASIMLNAVYDSCSNEIDLSWVHYVGWGNRIEEYKIFFGEARDWESLPEVGSAQGNKTVFSQPVEPNREYMMYVMAKKTDSDFTSRSNIYIVKTNIAQWPEFVTIDSVLSADKQIAIRFTIDQQTELRNFALYRWSVPVENSTALFTKKELFKFTNPSENLFIDTSDMWDARSKPFYYRLISYDGCMREATLSNPVNSVPLRVVTRNLSNTITWNGLLYSKGNPVKFSVYRIVYGDQQLPVELAFETSNETDTIFIDDVSSYEGQGLTNKFCYYVEAEEFDESGSGVVFARTRLVCTEVTPEIIMPNAIDPLSTQVNSSGGNPRNYFAPTISFLTDYKLTIYNRWGGIVFVGENEGWNGYDANGGLAKEGSYIYRLEVKLENKRIIVKTGYLSVIYAPH